MGREGGPIEIGTVIKGRYKVKKTVAKGGFAVVYKAREPALGRFVAIKALDSRWTDCPDVRRRFLDEARKLAKISNPHVVDVYNNGRYNGVPYFVMEFVSYTVHELIHEDFDGGPVEHDLARRLLKQTLQGMCAIHRRKWTHRDIKPDNILLTADDEVRLADFGVMKDPSLRRTVAGVNFGTPKWMAPEQRAGEEVSTAADVYAFGLVACRMISGQCWSGDQPVDLAQFTDRGTAGLLESCLADRPTARPHDAQAVLQKWESIERKVQGRRPRRQTRGDALVGNVRTRIEREYGLPSGSVKLFYPKSKQPVRADVRIARVRKMWGG